MTRSEPESGACVLLSDLRTAAQQLANSEHVVNNCREMADRVDSAARELGVPTECLRVRQGWFNGRAGRAEHFWVEVDPVALDVDSEWPDGWWVIVDASYGQFTEEKYQMGIVAASAGPTGEVKGSVAVATPDDSLYDCYE